MRTSVVIACVVGAVVGCAGTGHAEPIGSPAGILKKGKWVFTLGGGATLDRPLDGDATVAIIHGGHGRGYGLTDRLSLYGKIGAASVEVEDPSIQTRDLSTTHDYGMNLLTSLQLKSKLWESQDEQWEWDGSVQYVDIRRGQKGDTEGRWHQWQVATSLARSLGRFKPYGGVVLSAVSFHYKVLENGVILKQGRYHEDGMVGLVLGTDIYAGQDQAIIVNLEGLYVESAEINVTASYRF